MKITVFTSNQPRHLALVERLASICDTTFAVMECSTVFPGLVEDFFKKSNVMQKYFENVMRAEKKIFGDLSFSQHNVKTLAIKNGDLNYLSREQLAPALDSDIYVVFSASFIKGWLIDFLIDRRAINIHMGISPYYRGSSCNFWALYDNRPELVGSTIHLLSKGLDSGPMLYHALPTFDNTDPFDFTMTAVEAAQLSLVRLLGSGEYFNLEPVPQEKTGEIRYTRNADFTDDVAAEFLSRNLTAATLRDVLVNAHTPTLLHPFYT